MDSKPNSIQEFHKCFFNCQPNRSCWIFIDRWWGWRGNGRVFSRPQNEFAGIYLREIASFCSAYFSLKLIRKVLKENVYICFSSSTLMWLDGKASHLTTEIICMNWLIEFGQTETLLKYSLICICSFKVLSDSILVVHRQQTKSLFKLKSSSENSRRTQD